MKVLRPHPSHPGRSILASCVLLLATASTVHSQGIRTVLVSPVPGNPAASGAALLAAVSGIPSPSNSNRWVVKVEPGIYDLAGTPLLMRAWVDVEGSGLTRIVGDGQPSIFGGVVEMASNCELRDLTVVANGAGRAPAAVAIWAPGSTSSRVVNVHAVAKNGTQNNEAILLLSASDFELRDVEAEAQGGELTFGLSVLILSAPGGDVRVDRASFLATGASQINRAVALQFDNPPSVLPSLTNVTGSALGGTENHALEIQMPPTAVPGEVRIKGSRFLASGGTAGDVGVLVLSGQGMVRLLETAVEAPALGSTGLWLSGTSQATVRIEGGAIAGGIHTVANTTAMGRVGVAGTQLAGGAVLTTTPGSLICAGVHDEIFAFFGSTCP
ncbi:MAG TPA: hypothetical protein VF017_03755 [Thermoanaerobaculia bacterium]|nr:hypothetical protein [Thermoanaerobaculia bacterium]